MMTTFSCPRQGSRASVANFSKANVFSNHRPAKLVGPMKVAPEELKENEDIWFARQIKDIEGPAARSLGTHGEMMTAKR